MNQKHLQRQITATIDFSNKILDEIETKVDNLQTIWQMRYSTKDFELELSVKSLLHFIKGAYKWRSERIHLTDEDIKKRGLPKSITLCDAQGNFYDKRS